MMTIRGGQTISAVCSAVGANVNIRSGFCTTLLTAPCSGGSLIGPRPNSTKVSVRRSIDTRHENGVLSSYLTESVEHREREVFLSKASGFILKWWNLRLFLSSFFTFLYFSFSTLSPQRSMSIPKVLPRSEESREVEASAAGGAMRVAGSSERRVKSREGSQSIRTPAA